VRGVYLGYGYLAYYLETHITRELTVIFDLGPKFRHPLSEKLLGNIALDSRKKLFRRPQSGYFLLKTAHRRIFLFLILYSYEKSVI
jgi:hypothetical protein